MVFVLLSSVDGGFSGDWTRYGLITEEMEQTLKSTVESIGYFHLFCIPIAGYSAKQKNQPVIPAVLHTSLIGGLGLCKVLFQTDENACDYPKTRKVASGAKQLLANLVAGVYDEGIINEMIDKDLSENPCVMYSFSTCPYCVKAKQILVEELGATVKCIELDIDRKIGFAIRAELGKRTGRTSVPSVWIGGAFIGGCDDGGTGGGGIAALQAAGQLKPLLVDASAIPVLEDVESESEGTLTVGDTIAALYSKYRPIAFFSLPLILYIAALVGERILSF